MPSSVTLDTSFHDHSCRYQRGQKLKQADIELLLILILEVSKRKHIKELIKLKASTAVADIQQYTAEVCGRYFNMVRT